jgi:hypothetical protein
VKQEKIYQAMLVAALLIQSAAIDSTAAAQSKKNRKGTGSATSTAGGQVNSTPGQATGATTPTLAPGKANNRETPLAPAPSAAERTGSADTKAAANASAARYSYEFKQPNFNVSRVVIEHDAAGRGHVSFVRKDSEELFTDPLQIPPAALARILAAWEALKFLDSETSYQAEKQFPHLGAMTLGMKQGTRERKAEFNWTHDEQAGALVKEYRGIGEQQLFIFDVTLARQYQPSDTVKIFKRLESLLSRNELSDTAPLIPVLRDLATDERIPLMARNHATRLLKKIEK